MNNSHCYRILPSALIALLASGSASFANDEASLTESIEQFFSGADLVSGPNVVDCTLSGGTETSCFSITVKAAPQSYTPGPWCPTNIADSAEAGGIWLRDGEVHDVDGAFIANLAEFYGDSEWQLFDKDTGNIRFTGSLEACQAAARPDVDPAYQNYCVQCLPEYMPDDATVTYVIPVEPQPVRRSQPTNFSGSGVAYNGIKLDGPAPLDAILAAHTIAPFDDCGGHVNPHVGYHYHAVTDCLTPAPATFGSVHGAAAVEHGTQIGIAMDGFQIFSNLMASGAAPKDLDSCNGHDGEDLAYHYHAGAAGSNAILGCLKAEAGCTLEDENAVCDASVRPPRS
ncbi:YHYH protein [Roseovarius sp. Pro17]|uniref:YHYH protein n=1 Tax=Roseovarius sp. Pro17 TaxID=3108175 RepID=UPI002D764F58|nr:YHYH protein [Roseovarius sp. Pro17]